MRVFRDRLRILAGILAVLGLGATAPVLAQPPTPSPTQTWDPFFDNTVLHEIRLAVSSRDWQSLQEHYLDNTYYPADFRWRDQTVRNVAIRSRGVGSRNGIKPGLNVHFDYYVTGQEFLGLKSFVLRNNINADPNNQDRSFLHESLSLLLFHRLGHPAPRQAHAKVFVNNNYVGLYRIVQALDHEFLQETFNEQGGYLYKYDYPADAKPYYFEDRGADPRQYVPLPFKPETHKLDSRPEVIAQWIQTINQASDATFRTSVSEYLDPVSFIRHVALENFLADTDGVLGTWGVNNLYVYRPETTKQFVFIGWDLGKTFLGSFDFDIFHNVNGVPDAQKNRLMTRMLAVPEFYNLYLDTLAECVRSANELPPGSTNGPNWMQREIQRQYELIRDAARADPGKPFTNEDFEQAISDLTVFARQRGDSVTRQVSAARAR
jgi:spore coat protein CotH